MIIRKIQNLLESASLSIDNLDAITVCLGPGSFTGLRIALAAAKGMATALEIPVVGINLFDIAAYKLGQQTEPVCVIAPFIRDEYFIVDISDGQADIGSAQTVSSNGLAEYVKNRKLAAIGFDLKLEFGDKGSNREIFLIDYDCSDLIYLASNRLNLGQSDDLETLEPLYLRKSQAEIKYDKRQKQQ